MSIIRIKRSAASGSPGALAQGEMAYSFLSGTQSNGGDRLYVGTGTEIGGVAANIEVIGGKYFTDKLDHIPGVVTANSALIVDINSKLDSLNVDNITIDGNIIRSTDTNGNIVLDPNGTGSVSVSSARIVNLAEPSATTDATTKQYVDGKFAGGATAFSIAADVGITDPVLTNQIVTFTGDTGLTTTVTNNTITIDLDDTAVTPGSYGNTTAIATFTVDQQGRITNAGTATIATNLAISGDLATSDTVSLLTDTLAFKGNTGITVLVSNNQVDVDLDDTAVTPGSYGSASEVPVITVDQQGRITGASTTTVARTLNLAGDGGTDAVNLLTDTLTVTGGVGLTSAVTNNQITINLDNTAVTAGSYGSGTAIPTFTVDAQGRITSASTTSVATNLLIAGDSGANTVSLLTDTLTVAGGTGLTSSVLGDIITISLDNTAVTPGTYGTATAIPTITIDQQGRITGAAANTIAIPHSQVTDWDEAVQDTVGGMLIGTQNGIAVTYTDNGEGGGYLNFDVNDPTVTLSGDVVGSATMTNLGNINISTTIQPNSVALGTDTTGNYVASLVAGTGVTLANNTGENATPTISIGQDVSTTANVEFASGTFTGNMTIDGDLVVGGNTVTINVTNLEVEDNMIYLNANSAVSNPDLGWAGGYNDGTYAHAGFFRDASDGRFKPFYGYTPEPDADVYINTAHASFKLGDMQANNFIGALVGNAATATKWATARTISLSGDVNGSVSIDGTQDVTISTTIQPNSIALGTDTTGNYAGSVAVSGNGLSITGSAGEGTDYTIQSNGTSLNTASTLVYRDSSRNFSANTITAALVGNASTASTLQTARTISLTGDVAGSVSFNGGSNVSITTTVQPNSVALGTDTTGNYVATIAVTPSTGLTISGSGSETAAVTLAGVNATTTVKGVASYDANNFTVTSGAVSLSAIDGGTY